VLGGLYRPDRPPQRGLIVPHSRSLAGRHRRHPRFARPTPPSASAATDHLCWWAACLQGFFSRRRRTRPAVVGSTCAENRDPRQPGASIPRSSPPSQQVRRSSSPPLSASGLRRTDAGRYGSAAWGWAHFRSSIGCLIISPSSSCCAEQLEETAGVPGDEDAPDTSEVFSSAAVETGASSFLGMMLAAMTTVDVSISSPSILPPFGKETCLKLSSQDALLVTLLVGNHQLHLKNPVGGAPVRPDRPASRCCWPIAGLSFP